MTFLMVHAAMPAWALAPKHDPNAPRKLKKEVKQAPKTRKLQASEMKKFKGRALGNPYYSGNAKYDMVYKGVNVRTGDYSLSATDLSFEGGYGIPVSVARTYSSNCIDEGPFGVGWNLSCDMRTTAGGLMKSSSAPVRSVPVNMRMRPSEETDPNLSTQPVEAVIMTDSTGTETTVQRDVDGVLTTPPWEKNVYDSEYEVVFDSGTRYEILISNKTTTPDGTVYEYEKKGVYTGGTRPWNDTLSTIDPEPCNVLKVVSATDRNGNETTFSYGSTDVTFVKSNGTTSEKPLVGVDMPNGRFIDFTWTGNRITKAEDNEREVIYAYSSGRLASVTSPGGRITRYTWGAPTDTNLSAKTGTYLLTAITDPRGLTTEIDYIAFDIDDLNYPGKVMAWQITEPNGFITQIRSQGRADAYYDLNCLPPGTNSFGTIAPDTTVIDYGRIGFGSGSGLISSNLDRDSGDTYNMKYYDAESLNLVEEITKLPLAAEGMGPEYMRKRILRTYNFMGNLLSDIAQELDQSDDPIKETQTEYAYWGEEKYFQRKATRVKQDATTFRYSYTDYYDTSASPGQKGAMRRSYDSKNTTFSLDTGISAPSHAVTGGYAWKYQLRPDDLDDYMASFDYDSKGRQTDAINLQRIVGGTREYVHTKLTYGADTAPEYGSAVSVVEDFGSGRTNRTTENTVFDVAGRCLVSVDGMGREFTTTYDGDGNLLTITRTDCVPSEPLVTYTYGSVDAEIDNGLPVSVVDELSGVTQSTTYVQSGVAKGLPENMTEVDGTESFDLLYEYSSSGDIKYLMLDSPVGQTRWHYDDWVSLGTPGSQARYSSRLNKQTLISSSWSDSAEEYTYEFDSWGRLQSATFARSPQSGQSDYSTYPAQSQARSEFTYDTGGRLLGIEYYWDVLSGGSYSASKIWACDTTYEGPLSLRSTMGFFEPASGGATWQLQRREDYLYEEGTDFLKEVDYNFGALQDVSWTYDASWNRISDSLNAGSWVYDELNQLVTSPSGSYTYDMVGNRLTGPSQEMTWDSMNRMTSLNNGSATYRYRADGLRISKTVSSTVTKYRHLGGMAIESTVTAPSSSTTFINTVGYRGVDGIATKTSSAIAWAYPIYDVSGNQKALLTRASSNSYSTSNWRSYDAWGNLIDGASTLTGDAQAQLGHQSDSESQLVFMRSRYYEPSTGRFVNEDPAREGTNWYVYAKNSPTSFIDANGQNTATALQGISVALGIAFGTIIGYALMAMWLQQRDPRWTPNNMLLLGGATLLGVAAEVVVLQGASPYGEKIFEVSIKSAAKTIMNSLRQTGARALARSSGLALLMGILVGILTALCEYILWEMDNPTYIAE